MKLKEHAKAKLELVLFTTREPAKCFICHCSTDKKLMVLTENLEVLFICPKCQREHEEELEELWHVPI